MYHFHCDEEGMAWRLIGHVAHMCSELGLHRSDSLFKAFPDDADRDKVVKLFWSIYVLDRRWSFGTGLPFVMQDADIDPNLPEPVSMNQSIPADLLTSSGPANTIPEHHDFIFTYLRQSVAINHWLRTCLNSRPKEGRHWLSRLSDPAMAESYSSRASTSNRRCAPDVVSSNASSADTVVSSGKPDADLNI